MVLTRNLTSAAAERYGERLAVVSDRACVSYADLDLRLRRLAGTLGMRGVSPGDRVVVFMDNAIEAIVAILGVLRAGAVLVPLGPDADASDLATVLEDCQPVALITEARLAAASAEALRGSDALRLVVLASDDRGAMSETCVSFEDATGRAARWPDQHSEATLQDQALMLVYRRTPAGLAAPVTLTETDVVLHPARDAVGAVVDDVRPMAGARGVAALLSAIFEGSTIVLRSGRTRAQSARASAA